MISAKRYGPTQQVIHLAGKPRAVLSKHLVVADCRRHPWRSSPEQPRDEPPRFAEGVKRN